MCIWPTTCGSAVASRSRSSAPSTGTTHYNAGRYDRALEEYQRAYELVPAPGLLFNLGQCYRELGRRDEAIASFEQYLQERPDAPNRALVEDLLRELRPREDSAAEAREQAALTELERARQELEAARQAGTARLEQERERYESALEELERARHELEATRVRMLERAQQDEAARARVAAAPPPPPSSPEFYEEWWFWAIVVGVVVGAGAITASVLLGQSPTLPSGSLGTIDTR